MQTCFFALCGVLPEEEAIVAIKAAIAKTYGKRGEVVVEHNYAAVDRALAACTQVEVPATRHRTRRLCPAVPDAAPDFVHRVTAMMMAGRGDLLPVSAMPVDGTFPTATARWEKRSIAARDPDLGRGDLHRLRQVRTGLPARRHPDQGLRSSDALAGAPDGFPTKEGKWPRPRRAQLTVQVAPDDCTGCGVCVDVCPAKNKEEVRHKAINMRPKRRPSGRRAGQRGLLPRHPRAAAPRSSSTR